MDSHLYKAKIKAKINIGLHPARHCLDSNYLSIKRHGFYGPDVLIKPTKIFFLTFRIKSRNFPNH